MTAMTIPPVGPKPATEPQEPNPLDPDAPEPDEPEPHPDPEPRGSRQVGGLGERPPNRIQSFSITPWPA